MARVRPEGEPSCWGKKKRGKAGQIKSAPSNQKAIEGTQDPSGGVEGNSSFFSRARHVGGGGGRSARHKTRNEKRHQEKQPSWASEAKDKGSVSKLKKKRSRHGRLPQKRGTFGMKKKRGHKGKVGQEGGFRERGAGINNALPLLNPADHGQRTVSGLQPGRRQRRGE